MSRLVAVGIPAAFALLLVFSSAGALAATDPTVGSHSGKVGRHLLVDDPTYPGAECKYDGNGAFKSIRTRPPIGYAYNASRKTDTGEVGYRLVLQVAPSAWSPESQWRDIDRSGYTQDHTTDTHNVDWPSWKSLKLAKDADPKAFYRMSIQFRWTVGGYTTTIGKASTPVRFYAVVPQGGLYRVACAGSQRVKAPEPEVGAADPKIGAHVLFDNAAYPGATCRYRQVGAVLQLDRITVQPPIVFAADQTKSLDTQKVAWRFWIQATDSPRPAAADWTDVATAALKRGLATDEYNAQWSARSLSVANLTPHLSWRVIVQMRAFASDVPHDATGIVTRYQLRTAGRVIDANAASCDGLRG